MTAKTETKWTPGPWTLHRLSNLKRVGTARFAVQAGAWTFYAGTEGNARLVAAAPDLYAALEALASAVFEERPTRDAMGMAMNALNRVHGQE